MVLRRGSCGQPEPSRFWSQAPALGGSVSPEAELYSHPSIRQGNPLSPVAASVDNYMLHMRHILVHIVTKRFQPYSLESGCLTEQQSSEGSASSNEWGRHYPKPDVTDPVVRIDLTATGLKNSHGFSLGDRDQQDVGLGFHVANSGGSHGVWQPACRGEGASGRQRPQDGQAGGHHGVAAAG
jgi:hypothetical protein